MYALALAIAAALVRVVSRNPQNSPSTPFVVYINLDSSTERNQHMVHHLKTLGLEFLRIPAFTPDELFPTPKGAASPPPPPPYVPTLPLNVKKLISVTTSHLEAIYQAYLQAPPSSPRYALVLEDDVEILVPNVDWAALVLSAPSNWTFLQLLTSNKAALVTLREMWPNRTSTGIGGQWIPQAYVHDERLLGQGNGLLWLRRNNQVWAAGAYIVNLDHLDHLLSNATALELSNRRRRFDPTLTFIERCDRTKTSIAARLRCAGKIKYYADKFIYELGGRDNAYVCTVPFVNFLANVSSLMSWQHKGVQYHAALAIDQLAKELAMQSAWQIPPILAREKGG